MLLFRQCSSLWHGLVFGGSLKKKIENCNQFSIFVFRPKHSKSLTELPKGEGEESICSVAVVSSVVVNCGTMSLVKKFVFMDAIRRVRPGCYYTRERHAVVLQEMKPTKKHFRSALRCRWCRLQKKKKKKKIQISHHCLNVNRVVSISKFPNKFARLKIWINVNIRGLFFALALVMADDVPCSWRVLSLSKINRSVFEHLMTHQGVHYQKWRNLSKDSEFFLYWIVIYNHQSERESIKAFHGRINLVAGGTCWHLSVFLKIRTETLTEILFSWR